MTAIPYAFFKIIILKKRLGLSVSVPPALAGEMTLQSSTVFYLIVVSRYTVKLFVIFHI